jgi:RNA recognition motif-containing protein
MRRPIATLSSRSMKLYVGNLPWSIGNQELEDLFSSYGTVTSANVITDRDTNRSRGFGFVELDDGGAEAIEALNESEVDGRKVIVNEARPK